MAESTTSETSRPLIPANGKGAMVRRVLLHPVMPVIVFAVASTYLEKIDPASKGEFYPFSNYPMYANPRDRELEYFFLHDGDDQPIASHKHTGFTAARIKKLMRSELQAWAKDNGLKWNKKSSWMTDEIKSDAASRVLAYLRTRSHELGNPLPDTVQMMQAFIFVDEERRLSERARSIAVNHETTDNAETDAGNSAEDAPVASEEEKAQ